MTVTYSVQDKSKLTGSAIKELQGGIKGRVILPSNADYDKARRIFYGGFDRKPGAIVRVAGPEDIIQVISLARQEGLELAVRGGGHSTAGYCTSDGGLVIDLHNLRGMHIDLKHRTALAEAGMTAGEYTTAAGAHGLVTGFGDTGSVGIGGLTLGGGVGYLVRKFGLTIDDLLAAEIVTADGQLLHVDSDSHPELFWALRGGGGNFGVVTRFEYRLHELPKAVGGMLILPATADVIAAFVSEAASAPDELSTIANVMAAPPMPFLPAEVHGKMVLFTLMLYAGAMDKAESVLSPFRRMAKPLADMLKPMTYPELFQPEPEDYHPVAAARTMFVDHIDQAVAARILERLQACTGTMAVAQLRVLGGAMSRVASDATAFAHRDSRIMVNLAALYENQVEKTTHEDWVSKFAADIKQDDSGAYVNFLGAEGPDRIRVAYPLKTWTRLAEIKARYDPTNLFRMNQNIPPSNKPS